MLESFYFFLSVCLTFGGSAASFPFLRLANVCLHQQSGNVHHVIIVRIDDVMSHEES